MKCSCGADMIWEGDFIFGKLVCKAKCAGKEGGLVWEEYPPDTEARDAVLEDNGVYIRDGVWTAECCRCEQRTEFYGDPDELAAHFLAGGDYQHHCGGSPRCCP